MARKRENNEAAGTDPNAWMVTFSDLIILLSTFFVLLLSMSSMDNRAVKEVFGLLMGASGPLESVNEKDVRHVMDPGRGFITRIP